MITWTLISLNILITIAWVADYGINHGFRYLRHCKSQGRVVL